MKRSPEFLTQLILETVHILMRGHHLQLIMADPSQVTTDSTLPKLKQAAVEAKQDTSCRLITDHLTIKLLNFKEMIIKLTHLTITLCL